MTLRRGPQGAWGVAAAPLAASPPPTPASTPEETMLAATLRALGLRSADLVGGMTMLVTPPWGSSAVPDRPADGPATDPVIEAPRAADWQWTPVDPDALARHEGVRPVVLTTEDADRPAEGSAYLVSAAGTLGWRPPLEQLAELPALASHALRLRFVVDMAEQRALAAALRYARAADAARQTATLLQAHELSTLAVTPSLFIEVDALFGAATETLDAVARLVEDAFGGPREPTPRGRRTFEARLLRARGTPPELRDALLGVWDAHGAAAAGHRRAVRRAAAAELGPPTVRVHRLTDGAWTVRLPITAEPIGVGAGGAGRRGRQDAFGLAWTFATEAWRAATLAIYAAART